MKYLLVLFLSLASIPAYAKDYGSYTGAVYVRNYDGDTITFHLFGYPALLGQEIGVRVRGIDTPEVRGKCDKEKKLAKDAQLLVQSIMKNANTIILSNMTRGKYFRIVADVVADGKNVSDVLIETGLAVRYDGGKKTVKWCGLYF